MTCSRDVNTTRPRGDHPLVFDCVSYDGECLRPGLSIRHEVVGIRKIQLVDFFSRHELVDLDRSLAFDRHGLQLFGLDGNIVALVLLKGFDDVFPVDFAAGVRIDFPVLDAVASFSIDLMKVNFFSF